ncbi:MAG: 4Fe-4S ferredoxin [Chloroflexi bacterium]|mgnify:FL=1|nr:4Fe-4S ferredoxin [Chloroflexota bacterium]MDP6800554.1 polysulfide reductase NrfD [SAR202 cluster bacterium]MQG57809.1 4Fe-4S dicluster domain-containing protein [SAR202 cluster bacterium]HAL48863.1 4Fe-4S ferredoxin [Dehalococcoidia bacterium]|tara:strand:- start:4547 stop:6088 length:1542 start_codon:yes stop_codon:yes gene_type:complete
MTRYGFVLDQRKCIGCHACTVACKAENNVPVGSFRTWVKYVEKGEFPNARRHFAVLRCNHCDNPPCVAICPTSALFKRDDGIVDFDRDRCVGCRACMQACPYDALYADGNNLNTAAKCNFCAPRLENSMLPSCQTTCPVQAVTSGDMDDPASDVAQLVARESTMVRKPDKGTGPQVFYVGADDSTLNPGMTRQSGSYLWADLRPDGVLPAMTSSLNGANGGAPLTVYDVPHQTHWGVTVSALLWTKSVAAGAMMAAAIILGLGFSEDLDLFGSAASAVGLLFMAFTGTLLISHLGRPERFMAILLKPNFSSWLVKGSYVLMTFGAFCVVWLVLGLSDSLIAMRAVSWAVAATGAMAAGYSALLFGQAKARDLWLGALVFPHLLVQAVLAGTSALLLAGLAIGSGQEDTDLLVKILAGVVSVHGVFVLSEAFLARHGGDAAKAARHMVSGSRRYLFWVGAIAGGVIAPIALLVLHLNVESNMNGLWAAAAALALVGLFIYENIWLEAGQSVPLS